MMKAHPPSPRRMGITWRIALLSWLVTSVTLVVFVFVIVPEQKRTYLENLESKARGISASLQDVTAGAVVTEDYSSVVDHCKQVLEGDRSIHFLVITKNDGFSLIHETGGTTHTAEATALSLEAQWRTDSLGVYWHPAARKSQSGIDTVPVFNRRLFHYARPFDYSGIEWGWIHVGLSLEAYDQSVSGVYQRTGLLAVICLLISLGASVVYARRLIHPLLDLNAVVSRVTAGDLSARSDIRTGDEIQDLAHSFNTMTVTLQHRDAILQGVRFAAQQFLRAGYSDEVIRNVLERLLQAAAASRVYVFRNHARKDGALLMSIAFESVAPGVSAEVENPDLQSLPYVEGGFQHWIERLSRGEPVHELVADMPAACRELLIRQGIRSLCVMPVFVEQHWWGFIGFDQCDWPRVWSEAERDSLRAAADMLGAAIERKRNQDALLEAKENLEERVRQRTRELEAQVAATERAMAELAEAQQRLVETSRQAGMAEVATGVLHNVGNVLNSVNVSCTLVLDRVKQSEIANLPKLVALLETQDGHLAEFLTQDPKGRQIPRYLSSLVPVLLEEQSVALRELQSLREKIDHIKEIVVMQQDYARISGVIDTLPLTQLVEDAIKLNAGALDRHGVLLVRQFDEVPPVATEKHKVLQILLNLIRNAKYACDDGGREPKLLTLRVFSPRPDWVRIQVVDNGVGIPPENLIKIFSHGFTTRKGGHGFGLHSGALAAKELGGSLVAESAGLGRGASFTLELPVKQ